MSKISQSYHDKTPLFKGLKLKGKIKDLCVFVVGCVLARTRRIVHRFGKMRACEHAPYSFAFFYHKGLLRPN
jgi:hypothetical protein